MSIKIHKIKSHINMNIWILKYQKKMHFYNQINIIIMMKRMKSYKKSLWRVIKIKIEKNIINE